MATTLELTLVIVHGASLRWRLSSNPNVTNQKSRVIGSHAPDDALWQILDVAEPTAAKHQNTEQLSFDF